MKRMLSNRDMIRILKAKDPSMSQSKILEYPDLNQYASLHELLPESYDYRIILVEDKPHQGHWTCMIREGKNLFLF